MQATTLPQSTAVISDIKKVFTAAGLGVSTFFTSKFGRGSNTRVTPKLPQRRIDAIATNFPTLKEAAEVDASLLGNKGLNLSNLLALGFEVPSGFVVTTRAYEEHIHDSGADELIEELNSAATENGSTDFSQQCEEIKARILSHPVSEVLDRAIGDFLAQRQGTLGVAVRSSSNQEDSNGKAFAGQFNTYLNIKSSAEVSEAIKKVWASLWTPHVITYQKSMAMQADGSSAAFPKMAVVVQEMVDSHVSGVAFTINPMGPTDEMMIESYFGQGEMVVAGEVSPDQFIIAKNDKLEIRRTKINLTKQSVACADKTESGGLNVRYLPKDLASAVSLNDERVKLVAQLALKVENTFECPQDIEFAFDKHGKLFLLQARPITTNNWQQKFSFLKEWKAPGPGMWQLEGVHMPQSMSKMFFNVYPNNQKVAMQRSARVSCSMLDYVEHKEVNGFAYMCMRFVGAPEDARGPPPKLLFKLAQRFHPAIRERFKNAENVFKDKICRKDMEYWLKEDKLNCYNRNIKLAAVERSKLTDDEVWAHLMDCYENAGYMVQKHHIYTFTSLLPLQDFLAHMKYDWGLDIKSGISIIRGTALIGSGVEEFMAEEVFEAFQKDPEALLLLEQTENPAAVIESLKSRSRVGPVVKKYEIQAGHRLTNGYDVVQQTLIEQPALLLHGLKKTYLYGAGQLPQTTPSQSEINEVRNRVPEKDRALFDELLAEAQFMHPLRDERSMYGDMMGIGLLRHAMLEVGQRLVNRNILPNKELATEADLPELELLYKTYAPNEETEALSKLFADRLLYRKTVTIQDVPQHLGPAPPAGPKIPPVDWFPKHTHRLVKAVSIIADLMWEQSQNTIESIINDKKLIGAPGSKGTVEGKVTVIRSIEADRHKFKPGDILVTYSTSSAFCMMLSQSSGVIAQEGGSLTHAAITARELNIPAVVACKGVMETLKDGMKVRVNGTTGEVFILDDTSYSEKIRVLTNSA